MWCGRPSFSMGGPSKTATGYIAVLFLYYVFYKTPSVLISVCLNLIPIFQILYILCNRELPTPL